MAAGPIGGAVGRGRAGRRLALYLLPACLPAALLAQSDRRCLLRLEHADHSSHTRVTDEIRNDFFGGDVRYRCRGQNVRMWTDSVASFQGQVVYFIGNFRFEDEQSRVTSDFGTYYEANERWEARGNVVYTDKLDGSTLRGPMVDYFRGIRGTARTEREIFAAQRPTLTVAVRDTLNRPEEPYLVVADRIRMKGDTEMWAGGRVTIDRSDLTGRSDSLALDTGDRGLGMMIGQASIVRPAADSFRLSGQQIDLALEQKQLTYITGRDSAMLTGRDLDLDASTIGLDLEAQKVIQTLAWGRGSGRPVARADEYEIRADSLAIDTPDERLRELRAFRQAWVGFKPDTLGGDRDYVAGDTVTAAFASDSAAAGGKPALRTLDSRGKALMFYRTPAAAGSGGRSSMNYSRADRIVLTTTGIDSLKVQKVQLFGTVDGIQLNPEPVRPDTARRDTTGAVRRPRSR
jgi:hypothetical protein